MLEAEGKITDSVIENMINWRHSGFNVYCGNAIWPHNDEGLENLARYIIRASFSQERMAYIIFDAIDDVKVQFVVFICHQEINILRFPITEIFL